MANKFDRTYAASLGLLAGSIKQIYWMNLLPVFINDDDGEGKRRNHFEQIRDVIWNGNRCIRWSMKRMGVLMELFRGKPYLLLFSDCKNLQIRKGKTS